MGIWQSAYPLAFLILAWTEIYVLMTIAKIVVARRERANALRPEVQAVIKRRLGISL